MFFSIWFVLSHQLTTINYLSNTTPINSPEIELKDQLVRKKRYNFNLINSNMNEQETAPFLFL